MPVDHTLATYRKREGVGGGGGEEGEEEEEEGCEGDDDV